MAFMYKRDGRGGGGGEAGSAHEEKFRKEKDKSSRDFSFRWKGSRSTSAGQRSTRFLVLPHVPYATRLTSPDVNIFEGWANFS